MDDAMIMYALNATSSARNSASKDSNGGESDVETSTAQVTALFLLVICIGGLILFLLLCFYFGKTVVDKLRCNNGRRRNRCSGGSSSSSNSSDEGEEDAHGLAKESVEQRRKRMMMMLPWKKTAVEGDNRLKDETSNKYDKHDDDDDSGDGGDDDDDDDDGGDDDDGQTGEDKEDTECSDRSLISDIDHAFAKYREIVSVENSEKNLTNLMTSSSSDSVFSASMTFVSSCKPPSTSTTSSSKNITSLSKNVTSSKEVTDGASVQSKHVSFDSTEIHIERLENRPIIEAHQRPINDELRAQDNSAKATSLGDLPSKKVQSGWRCQKLSSDWTHSEDPIPHNIRAANVQNLTQTYPRKLPSDTQESSNSNSVVVVVADVHINSEGKSRVEIPRSHRSLSRLTQPAQVEEQAQRRCVSLEIQSRHSRSAGAVAARRVQSYEEQMLLRRSLALDRDPLRITEFLKGPRDEGTLPSADRTADRKVWFSRQPQLMDVGFSGDGSRPGMSYLSRQAARDSSNEVGETITSLSGVARIASNVSGVCTKLLQSRSTADGGDRSGMVTPAYGGGQESVLLSVKPTAVTEVSRREIFKIAAVQQNVVAKKDTVLTISDGKVGNSFDSVPTDYDAPESSSQRGEVTTTSIESSTTTASSESTGDNKNKRHQIRDDSGYKSLEAQQSLGKTGSLSLDAQQSLGRTKSQSLEGQQSLGRDNISSFEAQTCISDQPTLGKAESLPPLPPEALAFGETTKSFFAGARQLITRENAMKTTVKSRSEEGGKNEMKKLLNLKNFFLFSKSDSRFQNPAQDVESAQSGSTHLNDSPKRESTSGFFSVAATVNRSVELFRRNAGRYLSSAVSQTGGLIEKIHLSSKEDPCSSSATSGKEDVLPSGSPAGKECHLTNSGQLEQKHHAFGIFGRSSGDSRDLVSESCDLKNASDSTHCKRITNELETSTTTDNQWDYSTQTSIYSVARWSSSLAGESLRSSKVQQSPASPKFQSKTLPIKSQLQGTPMGNFQLIQPLPDAPAQTVPCEPGTYQFDKLTSPPICQVVGYPKPILKTMRYTEAVSESSGGSTNIQARGRVKTPRYVSQSPEFVRKTASKKRREYRSKKQIEEINEGSGGGMENPVEGTDRGSPCYIPPDAGSSGRAIQRLRTDTVLTTATQCTASRQSNINGNNFNRSVITSRIFGVGRSRIRSYPLSASDQERTTLLSRQQTRDVEISMMPHWEGETSRPGVGQSFSDQQLLPPTRRSANLEPYHDSIREEDEEDSPWMENKESEEDAEDGDPFDYS